MVEETSPQCICLSSSPLRKWDLYKPFLLVFTLLLLSTLPMTTSTCIAAGILILWPSRKLRLVRGHQPSLRITKHSLLASSPIQSNHATQNLTHNTYRDRPP